MKTPYPVNLQTPDEVRAAGWGAEGRDSAGHLITSHAPFSGEGADAQLIDYIREAMDAGHTVTIWPHKMGPRTVASPYQ